jgi:hypothetical protein
MILRRLLEREGILISVMLNIMREGKLLPSSTKGAVTIATIMEVVIDISLGGVQASPEESEEVNN